MSQTQQMSAAVVTDLLQSVGVEFVIFAITIAVAVAFRGIPFGKKKHAAKKLTEPRVQAARTNRPANESQAQRPPALGQTGVPANGLSKKVEAMIECANRRQAADAIAIYAEMRAKDEHTSIKDCVSIGRQRPTDVFSMLVQCAGSVGRPELIEVLLDDMVLAGIGRPLAFYESTMKMLAAKKCYKEAMSVCNRLEADGLEPSPTTLSCLINFAVEIGEVGRAIDFFNRLSATSTPSIRAYMTILRVFSKRQDWPKSFSVIQDMQHRRAAIDSLVLNVVLATGVAACELDAAEALLKEFSQMNIADVVSYNTVMKGFAQQKDVDRAVKLLDEMCQTAVRPNAITFNTVMDSAVRSSRVADACHVLARMRDAGLAPDKFTCTTLVKGLQNGANCELLTVILDLLRNVTNKCDSALCSSLFRNVLQAAAKVNDPTLTARAVSQMKEQRVMLSTSEYQQLLQVLDAKPRCNTASPSVAAADAPWRRK